MVDYTPPVLSIEETETIIDQGVDEEAKAELRNIAGALPKERLAEVLPMLVVRRADQIREFGRARGLGSSGGGRAADRRVPGRDYPGRGHDPDRDRDAERLHAAAGGVR